MKLTIQIAGGVLLAAVMLAGIARLSPGMNPDAAAMNERIAKANAMIVASNEAKP